MPQHLIKGRGDYNHPKRGGGHARFDGHIGHTIFDGHS